MRYVKIEEKLEIFVQGDFMARSKNLCKSLITVLIFTLTFAVITPLFTVKPTAYGAGVNYVENHTLGRTF